MHVDTRKYNAAQAPKDRAICQLPAQEIDRSPIVGYGKLKDCMRLLYLVRRKGRLERLK